MKNNKRKHQFSISLIISTFVFVINAVAVGLAILILYILLRTDVIASIEGQHIRFRDAVVLLLVISVIIGFIITMLTSKFPLKTFNKIGNSLKSLANGDYSVRLHFKTALAHHPLIKDIESSFNLAAEELEHTEMLRNDFINNFSHEFKTPIVSIAGFAQLLKKGNLTEEEQAEYLDIIEYESLRLSSIATNVLNLTKVENQTILTDVTTFNLSEQIRSAILLLADKWESKQLDMDIDFKEYMISGNEKLLEQVWINLLDNAIKFSNVGDVVTVDISQDKKYKIVSISNHCKDISPESLRRIFNKFYQADESHSSLGNGIGLSIVKKIVSLHNGQINVESKDGLTTFSVTLP